jgi:hypothetical protein
MIEEWSRLDSYWIRTTLKSMSKCGYEKQRDKHLIPKDIQNVCR